MKDFKVIVDNGSNVAASMIKNTPERNAPNTAPVSAIGGMPMVSIRIMPISVAHKSEYHGPNNTEHTILIKCAIGHIPSTLSIGDIITPSAISIESTIILSSFFELVILSPYLKILRILTHQ